MEKLTNIPTVVCEGPVQVFRPKSQVVVSHRPDLDTEVERFRNFGNYSFEAYATMAQQRVVGAPVDDDPRSQREPRLQDVVALRMG